ncbi:hypothetical protein K9N68_37630 (plasmid) [Kovacikia minuta CCNUW1]|uniref:hypothetical protein n=1 Tax=Kovacikia minuta TaxID=2931930 RepID=UPI001CCEAC0B|nr:hypothetical protein [Kovacikia minuta]UBF29935.1 hypothetical protein K9N68_37630 [Kovacikia minuta CCNUW1]
MTQVVESNFPKIDPSKKAIWVEALREGQYTQGQGYLRMEDTDEGEGCFCYCCLGVGLDLMDSSKWKKESHIYSYPSHFRNFNGYPPPEFFDWLGVPDNRDFNDGFYVENENGMNHAQLADEWWRVLASMNDKGYTFEEIADWIEQHL